MQILMKHPECGACHFDDKEQAEREAQGWVKWPRTKEQKAGIAPVAVAPLAPVETNAPSEPSSEITHQDLESRAAAIGLKVDRRWSISRFADEIRKAEAKG